MLTIPFLLSISCIITYRVICDYAEHKALIQIFGATRETFSPRVAPQTRISAQVTPFEQAITPLNGMTREVN